MPTSSQVTGPSASVIEVSQSNMASSSPIKKPKLSVTIQSETTPSTTYKSAPSSPKTPISPSDTIGSLSSVVSNESAAYHPVQIDQVIATLLDACMSTSLLYSTHKIPLKDSHVVTQLLDIKDEFSARQNDIAAAIGSPFVGKWLWTFYQSLIKLNTCVQKLRDSTYNKVFSTNSSRKAKVEKYFKNVLISYQELMMNFSLSSTSATTFPSINGSTGVNSNLVLGDKYLFGYGVPKSYDQAFKFYQSAAKQGVPEAYNMLGCMYEYGLGQTGDIQLAIESYKKSADSQYADAWNNLGRIYETGPKGVERDYSEAIACYTKAAKLGHLDAMVNIGFMAENGHGCNVDFVKAEEWFRQAAEKQYARAQNCLGALLYRKKEDREAFEMLKKAADQGNAHAMNNLGICYEEGRGTSKNMEQAKAFYKSAMELNHPSGTNNYGYLLLQERKFNEAAKYFNIAIALGSVDALYNLGTLYESGSLHVNKRPDPSMAKYYYQEAVSKGHSQATARLEKMQLH